MRDRRSYASFMLLSHVPMAGACLVADPFIACIYAMSVAASVAYHRSHETRFRVLDYRLAWLWVVCVVWQFACTPTWHTPLIAAAAVAIYASCVRTSCRNHYETYHPVWHVVAGVGTILLHLS